MIPILSSMPPVAGIPPEIVWPIAAVLVVGAGHAFLEFGDAVSSVSSRPHPILWKLLGKHENPTPLLDEYIRKKSLEPKPR